MQITTVGIPGSEHLAQITLSISTEKLRCENVASRWKCAVVSHPRRHRPVDGAPLFVKPYSDSNKTDAADAKAICEAVNSPSTSFVPLKNVEQQPGYSGAAAGLRKGSNGSAKALNCVAACRTGQA